MNFEYKALIFCTLGSHYEVLMHYLGLNQISKLLQFKEEEDHLYGISEEESIGLEKAFSDIKEGRVFSSVEANSILKKWLNS